MTFFKSGTSSALPEKWDEVIDVVVVGSGFAGLSAAIESHDAGCSVMVLEKMDKPGGNSWLGSVAIIDCLVFGRIAGQQIAKEAVSSQRYLVSRQG